MAEQRKDSRSAASLKVKYKSATVDDFVQQFGTDVSRGGIFIKTKSPLEAGALLKLELQLSNASAVISGIGRVAWRRAASQDPSKPTGMGIKFIKLEPASQAIVDRIVGERGATPSRFDQSEGAELARASLEPPAPSLPPERTSAPGRSGATSTMGAEPPITVRPPAPIAMPEAALPSKSQVIASQSAPVIAAPEAKVAAGAAPMRARIGPSKAAVPSGLFANSPLVQPSMTPSEDKRTSFFPPAPQPSAAQARGGSNASGSLSQPRSSSSGSASSPLHRPLHSRAPQALSTRAPAPAPAQSGPKGVFGAPSPASPLASSTSGMLRPAKEVAGPPSSLFPDRSADEAPTAAVPRPPMARSAPRSGPPVNKTAPLVASSSVLDSLAQEVFDDAAADSDDDGMFATLEPVPGMSQPEHARASRPSGVSAHDRVTSAAPTPDNGGAPGNGQLRGSRPSDVSRGSRPSQPSQHGGGLAAAEAADVDNLFAELEGGVDDDARTDEVVKPAAAVFSPGSARPSHPPHADDLAAADAFGEADLLGEDRGLPPFDDDEDEEEELPSAATAASEPPMLRLAEPAAAAETPAAKRPPLALIAIVVVVLLAIGAAVFFMKGRQGSSSAESAPAPVAQAAAPAPAPVAAEQPAAAAAPAAAPTAAPQAPAELTQVNITSLPRGADVRVGGAVVGQTPTNIELPIGREESVSVSAAGHASEARKVTATRGMDPLRFKLEPLPFVLAVTTTPAQAELSVGSVTSVSPAPLALGHVNGPVDLTISKDGWRRMTRQVRLDEFVEKDGVFRADIEVSLSPMPGTAEPSPATAEPVEEAPAPSRRSSRSRRSRGQPEGAPAPPEPESVSADQLEAPPEGESDPPDRPPVRLEEPDPEPSAPPPPPSLPSLPE